MSAALGLLERFTSAAERAERHHQRLEHMVGVLDRRIRAFRDSEPVTELWQHWIEELSAFDKDGPDFWERFERLVKRGYQIIQFERDPHTKDIAEQIPRDEAEFDRLPDPFDELRKRLRAV